MANGRPIVVTLTDLAAIYNANGQRITDIMRTADAELTGLPGRPGADGIPEMSRGELTSASGTTPGGAGHGGGAAGSATVNGAGAGNNSVRPYGGFLGSGYAAGASTLGQSRKPGSLSSPDVAFDAAGNPYLDSPNWGDFGDVTDDSGFAAAEALNDGGPVISEAGYDGVPDGLGGGGISPPIGESGGFSGGGSAIPAGLGGGGSGGSGALGVGGLTGAATLAATGSVPTATSGATAATSAGGVAGPTVAATPGRLGGMPMMPMGGMGAGGAGQGGQGGKPPAWLVEVDDVWGEDTVVTAPVIGGRRPPSHPGR